ncbi:right-handed parallel beta-helix repeat-containing protein [Enterobacter hormaechei]|nr:right-handed parallel beta-helix repeat-containing protein [Enterobacter hormaechei]
MAEQKVKLTDLPSATDTVDTAQLLINQNSTDQKLPVTHFLRAKNNLSDITNAEQARANINAPSVDEVNNKLTSYINGSYTFNAGANISSRKDYIWDEESKSWYYWTGDLPKDVPAASSPESTGGIGKGEWALIGATQPTIKTPFDFGAKGDGVTDDTLALQAYIDGVDGDIDLYGKTYLVSKNPALATTYPTEPDLANNGYNFCPCLALVGKKGIKIHNGALLVKTHGLDALSLIACEHVTVDLTINGPGVFPAIDTPTGYAEKGEARFGYDSALVLAPNNALDTSAYTGGAYAGVTGQFPKYNADGSQASGWQNTWGKFLGGNIGSWACGVKVQRACRGILINNCDISGFNFGAVGIGIRNTAAAYGASDYTTDADVPDGVMVINTRIRKCYSAGIYVLSGYRLNYMANNIEDIGHPDGDDALNASYDPGYGITHGRNRRIRNVTITENMIRNCRRKCIDFHGGGQAIIANNHCLEHGVVGIYAKCGPGWAPNYEPYNLIVADNYVRSRDVPASETTGLLIGAKYTRCIDVGGGGEATQATYPEPFIKIHNNYCELRAYDGVAINTGAGDDNYAVFQDIDISHNSVVMKCNTVNNTTEGIAVNAGAESNKVYRGQRIRMVGNSVKQFNNLSLNYRVIGYKISGIPKSIIAHGNTVDLNTLSQAGLLSSFVLDGRTYISFSGNQALSIGSRSTMSASDLIFYDNARISIPAGAASTSIPASLFRGVWQATIAQGLEMHLEQDRFNLQALGPQAFLRR